jgi:hypothetical protein
VLPVPVLVLQVDAQKSKQEQLRQVEWMVRVQQQQRQVEQQQLHLRQAQKAIRMQQQQRQVHLRQTK